MKTITMYELLGMVKDGEKLPKKVKVLDVIYELAYPYSDYLNKELHRYLFVYMASEDEWELANFLNVQVEIIEENKEEKKMPEKLETYKEDGEIFFDALCYKVIPIRRESLSPNERVIVDKLNEVLDYFKSKGDE